MERGLGDKVAYHWIGEPGDTRTLTYADLMRESSKAANALLELGVRKGDRVAIYMPMIPELPIAMLACARIGAPAHGGLRRVLGGVAVRPHQRLRRQGADHGGRRLAAGQEGGPQAPRGRGDRGHAHDRARDRRGPLRRRRAHGPAARPLVARHRGPPGRGLRARSPWTASTCSTCSTPRGRRRSRRGSCTRPRATSWAPRSPTGPSSTSSPTTSTGAPPTSAGSPGTATSSTAPSRTPRPGSCTRAPRMRRRGTAGGRSSSSTRSTSCTAPRPPSAPS